MKNGFILLIMAGFAMVLLNSCGDNNNNNNEKEASRVQNPINVTGTDTLTGDMGETLQAYYNIKNAFADSDTMLVNQGAMAFVTKVGAITLEGNKSDPAIIQLAEQIQKDLSTETKKLAEAPDIESKRKSFQIISDGLFDLLRTIRYSGSKVYQLYCPMAFNNKGATWLSKSSEIVNPYFGAAMLHCGEVRDSVNIAPK